MSYLESNQALTAMVPGHDSSIYVSNSRYIPYEIYVMYALIHHVKDQNDQPLSDDDVHEVLQFMRNTFAAQDCYPLLRKLRTPGDKLTRSVRTTTETEVELWTVLAKEQYYGYMIRHQGIVNQLKAQGRLGDDWVIRHPPLNPQVKPIAHNDSHFTIFDCHLTCALSTYVRDKHAVPLPDEMINEILGSISGWGRIASNGPLDCRGLVQMLQSNHSQEYRDIYAKTVQHSEIWSLIARDAFADWVHRRSMSHPPAKAMGHYSITASEH